MIPRSKELFKTKDAENKWLSMGLFTPLYLRDLKTFCIQCLNALEVERHICMRNRERVKIEKDSIVKMIYSSESDVIYIYMSDRFTAQLLMETLNQWLITSDPLYKGTTMDKANDDIYIIELNYQDQNVIEHNKQNNIQNIVV